MYRDAEQYPLAIGTEAQVDEHLWSGHLAEAKELLEQSTENARDARHHLAIKQATLPLYELALNGVTNERIDRTVEVALEVADLLYDELRYFNQLSPRDDERERSRGRISELLLLGLQTRDIQYQTGPYLLLVPSTQADDKAGRLGTDFYLTPVGEDETRYPLYPIQAKTLNSDEHRDYFAKPINVIGINELDEQYYGRPLHHDSLAKTLLRDIRGTAVEGDSDRLNTAMMRFYELIKYKSEDGFDARDDKDDWHTLAAA